MMALMVSLPFGVCEEECFTEAPSCEQSCCCEHHNDSEASCNCSCVDECQTVHFEQRDFLTPDPEVSAPDASDDCIIVSSNFCEDILSSILTHGAGRLRAPPDLFVQAPRRITHCVYRL